MRLTSINTIKTLFEKHGFAFTKSLGQNFLINPSVCPKIAELGGAVKGVSALEIGTGIGVLTRELAARCDRVLAIEIDEGLKPILDETLSEFDNIEVIYGDVLTLNLAEIISERLNGDVICCANLPYYITSPVIMKLLEDKLPLKAITVMVQKEAGERITAMPGTRACGAISAAVRYYSDAAKLFSVPRGSFIPTPNVDSTVISLKPYATSPFKAADEKLFFKIVRTVFSQRRKQIINPLWDEFGTSCGLSKNDLRSMFDNAGISPAARAESLTMDDFLKLHNELFIKIKNKENYTA